MDTHQKQALLLSSQERIKIVKIKPIANLPYYVLDYIFSFLPMKVIAQLGILSSRFQNSWTLRTKLHVDQDFARRRSQTISKLLLMILSNVMQLQSFKVFDCILIQLE